MARSLSNLLNNLSEGIDKIKCKYGHNYKKCEACGITYEVCDCFLEYTNFKHDLLANLSIVKNVYDVTKIINKSFMKS